MTGDIATRLINNRKAWTSAEDERLRQRVLSNASLSDIAEDLGRTASAVRAGAHALRIALGHSRFIMKRTAKCSDDVHTPTLKAKEK
jgi:hypothetical protein